MSLPPSNWYPVNLRVRWLLLLGWGCVLGGYLVASTVKPDPRGFGTHQQFGLPPCSFKQFFGIPCPSCGGTTAVAHFVRGQWRNSIEANTAVFCLALLGLIYLPWSAASLWKARLLGIRVPTQAYLTILLTLCSIAVVQWGWRLLY